MRSSAKWSLVGVALVAAIATTGCGDRGERPAVRNVVLVSIDTCRADRIGAYGAAGDPTPRIDEIARGGTRFDRAYSPAPITLPAHASMMTGTIPPFHGLHDNGEGRLDDDHETLAERLRDGGFATAAVVGSFVLDARFGLGQGFDEYDDRVPRSGGAEWIDQRREGEVTDAARRFPGIVEFHEQLAIGLLTLQRPGDAIPHFRRVIELTPGNAGAHNNLGTALQQTAQPDAARAAFVDAVRLDPASASARLNLGASLALAGDVDGAERELRKALELRPDLDQARSLLQRIEGGEIR